MKIGLNIIILLLFSAAMLYAKKDIRIVRSIEFKDLNYVSKYEIIDSVEIYVKGKDIIIDMDSLEKSLNNLPLIKSYQIAEINQSLVVNIVENKPIFLLSIQDNGKDTLIELDNEFRTVSVNRAHALNMPLINISPEDIKKNRISSGLRSFLNLIYNLHKSDLRVMKEIIEMDYIDKLKTRVLLKGRKTVFIIKPDENSFNKLNYAVGYFDRIKYYPHYFTIIDGSGIITLQ